MGQWFRISCCLKFYLVLVLLAGYTVQLSISVCAILVSGEFWGTFSVTLFGPQIQSVV